MSIDYVCDLATDASVAEIASRVRDLIGGTIEAEEDQTTVVTGAVAANIRAITDARTREWSIEDWGIDPRIEISFTLNRAASEPESLAGRRDFTIASVKLGEELNVDVLLTFETERAIMRRQNGALTLYDWWPDWADPDVIATLPAGYTIVSDGMERRPDG
jgi:hypothetical protein